MHRPYTLFLRPEMIAAGGTLQGLQHLELADAVHARMSGLPYGCIYIYITRIQGLKLRAR